MIGTTRQMVMATGNSGKLKEIARLLSDTGIDIVAQSQLDVIPAEETGDTFVANALQKARNAARQTGLPAIADDSGLVVDALDGQPGVHSARYAGENATDQDNISKLLEAMKGQANRSAHFHCAAVYVRDATDEMPLIAEGRWHGQIAAAQEGTRGFGYDPVFVDPELGCTSAELTATEKNARSHRGQAITALSQMVIQALARSGGAS